MCAVIVGYVAGGPSRYRQRGEQRTGWWRRCATKIQKWYYNTPVRKLLVPGGGQKRNARYNGRRRKTVRRASGVYVPCVVYRRSGRIFRNRGRGVHRNSATETLKTWFRWRATGEMKQQKAYDVKQGMNGRGRAAAARRRYTVNDARTRLGEGRRRFGRTLTIVYLLRRSVTGRGRTVLRLSRRVYKTFSASRTT